MVIFLLSARRCFDEHVSEECETKRLALYKQRKDQHDAYVHRADLF